MTLLNVQSYVCGHWIDPAQGARDIANAVTGQVFARAGNDALDPAAMVAFARDRGGPALRAMTFHQRAKMLKLLAQYLNDRRDALYEASHATGATPADHRIDVDGGIGTMFVYAAKGRREMPDAHVLPDGDPEALSRNGTFLGQHIYTPLQGVAVHINAFNFPVWGMLEKLAPTLLAGMPAIVKPATATCYVTETCLRMIVESGVLPDGAVQLVCGGLGAALDLLDSQDAVTFTGSASTALHLRQNPNLLANAVRFTAEQDSLNASILGPDCGSDGPEFDLFITEVTREMTVKAGQKCTAIRRIIAPQALVPSLIAALAARLDDITIGDPLEKGVKMGPLVSAAQKADVLAKAALIGTEAKQVYTRDGFRPIGDTAANGAFVAPMLFHCADPDNAVHVHQTEAFGPVATIMGYRDLDHAAQLANRGQGSLVASVITRDGAVARQITAAAAAYHGRIYFNNRDSMGESTGHGAPMPHMTHGGPGRAGGGEELGGIRAVKHFMQRSAIQGSPDILTAITGKWMVGATAQPAAVHPFRQTFDALQIGTTHVTEPREILMQDIEHFAEFTGDTFYAHMDQAAAERNPFFPGRVAHGYLLLSFAAGLFVDPDEGPVLANTGLDRLRFKKPVSAGESICVHLTVMHKTPRNADYGEVRWHVRLVNLSGDEVAEYELLTMVATG